MREKARKIGALNERLILYSKQLGIYDEEIPKLIFTLEDWKLHRQKVINDYPQFKFSRNSRLKPYLGFCSNFERLICVRLDLYRNHSLEELTDTLIHELLHYRWPGISHKTIHERVRQVRRLRLTYPLKHIDRPLKRLLEDLRT